MRKNSFNDTLARSGHRGVLSSPRLHPTPASIVSDRGSPETFGERKTSEYEQHEEENDEDENPLQMLEAVTHHLEHREKPPAGRSATHHAYL